jgi:predicted NUDIX family phosphoesterase
MITQKSNQLQPPTPHDEQILVVRREHLFTSDAWHGLKPVNFDSYIAIIDQHKEFHWRSLMEEDPTFKQIIPYLIFQHEDTFFLMQRRPDASAKALQNKYSLGIGGHIRKEDMTNTSLFDWAQREFHEEVDYQGSLTIKPLGIINDDTNDVGRVHVGFALLLIGDCPHISIKSEHKSGTLLTLQECAHFYDRMETWSQFIYVLLNS